MIFWRPLYSLLDHPVQNVIVTGAWEVLGLIVGGADACGPAPAVHAAASKTRPSSPLHTFLASFIGGCPPFPASERRFRSSEVPLNHDLPSSAGPSEQPILRRAQRHGHGAQDRAVLPEHRHVHPGTELRQGMELSLDGAQQEV